MCGRAGSVCWGASRILRVLGVGRILGVLGGRWSVCGGKQNIRSVVGIGGVCVGR